MGRAIIYLRTSTKEQNPELQKQDCIDFCRDNNLEVLEIYSEQQSAYKSKARAIWDKIVKRLKKEKVNLVLWRYDRAFRNKKDFYEFMKVMFEIYNLKIYSVKEPSILSLWDMLSSFDNIENPSMRELVKNQVKLIWTFLIQQAGEEAEEESRRKSERISLAVRKQDGITKSYKGNKWGRKKKPINKEYILDLHKQGYSTYQIAKQYSDNPKFKSKISHMTVYNIIKKSLSISNT